MSALIIIGGGDLPCCDRARADADHDYNENFRKFERHEDMAAEPTRNNGHDGEDGSPSRR